MQKKMQINNCRKSDKQHQKGKLRTENKWRWKKNRQRKQWGRRELCLPYLFYFSDYLIRHRVLFKDRLFKIRWRNSERCCQSKLLLKKHSYVPVLFTTFALQWSSFFNDNLYFYVKFANFCIVRDVFPCQETTE